jgi:UDP-2,3-diacylglucosamine pyrophosphatase LpxH
METEKRNAADALGGAVRFPLVRLGKIRTVCTPQPPGLPEVFQLFLKWPTRFPLALVPMLAVPRAVRRTWSIRFPPLHSKAIPPAVVFEGHPEVRLSGRDRGSAGETWAHLTSMLVTISDLHLCDGTASRNPGIDAFGMLLTEIRANATKAEEVHLVLLGDIIDLVRTTWWHTNETGVADPVPLDARPWNGQLDPATGMNRDRAAVEKQFNAIAEGILRTSEVSAIFRLIDAEFRQLQSAGKRIRCTYIVGNHDRVLNNFQSLQDKISNALPSFGGITFRPNLTEDTYGVHLRHGHEWDENCNARILLETEEVQLDYLNPAHETEINRVMAIGEVITAELMSGLIYYVGLTDLDLAKRLMVVDNLRPELDVFKWLYWQASDRQFLEQKDKDLLIDALKFALNGVIRSSVAQQWNRVSPLIRTLRVALVLLRRSEIDTLRQIANILTTLHIGHSFGKDDRYFENAKREFKPTVQYVVYGHTHFAKSEFAAGTLDGKVSMYINTGTYLPLIRAASDDESFARSEQMTTTCFFTDQEAQAIFHQGGPRLERKLSEFRFADLVPYVPPP